MVFHLDFQLKTRTDKFQSLNDKAKLYRDKTVAFGRPSGLA